jgi:coenzyme F420-reducing hydrogenase delta subunit/NAD-dependent dihydropyrimidine dehydrogenase PreA subunit
MEFASPVNIIFLYNADLSGRWFDFPELALSAAGLPGARVLALDPEFPAQEMEARLRLFLQPQDKPAAVVAGLDPAARGRAVIRLLLEVFGLNPGRLALVDLHEALQFPDARFVPIKAQELIYLAALRVSLALGEAPLEQPVSVRALVWGDSWPALSAALELVQKGHPVLLAATGEGLTPLALEASRPDSPPEALAPLLAQVQEHPDIAIITGATLVDLQGGAGDFVARLNTPDGLRQEAVGAAILGPEVRLTSRLAAYGLEGRPGAMDLRELEERLVAPAKGAVSPMPQEAAFLLGFAGDTYPATLRRTLAAADLLLKQDGAVHLFLPHAKVAGPGLELALEAALEAGLRLYKLKAPPEIAVDKGRVSLSFIDPILGRPLMLRPDLVVVEDGWQAAPGVEALAPELNLGPAAPGFLLGDNVHYQDGLTSRRGLYVVGPGRGLGAAAAGLNDAKSAGAAAHNLLNQGRLQTLKGPAVVDRGRCVLCLTCYRLCPHGAITWDNRAIIRPADCQGCGACVSACPNDAIDYRPLTDAQVVAELRNLDPRLTPRIVAFMCQNSGWPAYHAALKLDPAVFPRGFTAFKLPCAGRADLEYLVKALVVGADAVMVLACHPDNCRSHRGNTLAHWRLMRAQGLVAEVGFDPRRLLFKSLAANSPQDFLAAVAELKSRL